MITKQLVNQIAYDVVKCAINVHKELGPGLLESVYQEAMEIELRNAGLRFIRQKEVPLIYKGEKLKSKLKLDLMVENLVIVELKSVDEFSPVNQAQLLTYMRLTQKPKGLLINMNCANITKCGLIPLVNNIFSDLPEENADVNLN